MDIIYTTINNKCFNTNDGSIKIESINLTESEIPVYGDGYEIIWSGDFSNSSISSDGLVASSLPNGTYFFKVVSTSVSDETPFYSGIITSPNQLSFEEVRYSNYSCGESASLYTKISGGSPPYAISVANSSINTNNNEVVFTGLRPGEFVLSVVDINECSVEYNDQIIIKEGSISYTINNIYAPQLLDSYATIDISVSGGGPFSFNFYNKNTEEYTYIDLYETKYLQNYSQETNEYNYIIDNLIVPGEYLLVIKNSAGCENIIESLNIPNISPISVNISLSSNTNESIPSYYTPLPIFDTLLIPYKFIKENHTIWTELKNKNIKDNISIFINEELYNFTIVRDTLNKSCLDDGSIEILKLGNDEKDWFYYFYIAPSFNKNTSPENLSAKFELKILDDKYNIILGLDENNNISSNSISLIMGSFILDGLGYNDFYNGCSVCCSLTEPETLADCDFKIQQIRKIVTSNMYSTGFVTVLNFLEQFNILNENVNINQSACNLSKQNYAYNIRIKQLLKTINNFNTSESFIYNPNSSAPNGYINLDISGNTFFALPSGENQINSYSIDFLFFNQDSDKPSNIYVGSELLRNTTSIEDIDNGFYIVRIKDIYDNRPKFVVYNDNTVSYDNHFLQSKKRIQNYNSSLLDYFEYGDLLVYLGEDLEIIEDPDIPSQPDPNEDLNLPEFSLVPSLRIVPQTKDLNNTSEINIELLNNNINCYLYGPKNYIEKFNSNTKFTNLVPGVYIILGDEKELKDASLYQNEIRINLQKNTEKNVFLEFVSYETIVSIKDQ